MDNYEEVQGDLIEMTEQGYFDVITHGVNCFCTMGAGIAVPMKKAFNVHLFDLESSYFLGDINKLGQIDYETVIRSNGYVIAPDEFNRFNPDSAVVVVNSYTQYKYGKNHKDGVNSPIDYTALRMCMRKINHEFKGKNIGLPKIGAGLAGGDWNKIKKIIQEELKDMQITVIIFKN